MLAPLPVITTRLGDRRDRGYLAWVAVANEVAHLVLDSAPIDGTPHALEIYVEGFDEPLVVLAEPVGEPNAEGFPLRLKPLDAAQADVLRHELFGGPPPDEKSLPPTPVRPKATASYRPPRRTQSEPPPMSTRHRQALKRSTGVGAPISSRVAEERAPGSLVGRALGDGRFSLDSLVGAGASGEVYRGTHAALRRPIAIKVLHPSLQNTPDYCARFYSEALAASQLDHRNVLRILDYGQEPDGLLYIVMEFLEGTNLETILHEEGPMSTERIVHLVAQACAGLAHAHDAGVVHRDIKPENIVVVKRRDDEGKKSELVKVCDFGIAHWQPAGTDEIGEDDATLIKRPDSSKVVGTPAYMAPEQIRNEQVDARADVYALGVVLYELATGRLPFDSERPMQVLMMHLNDAPTPPSRVRPEVSKNLERVILKALAKDPDKRQDNARVLRSELRSLVDEDSAFGSSASFRKISMSNVIVGTEFIERPADALAKLGAIDDAKLRYLGIDTLGQAIRSALAAAKIAVVKDLVGWLQTRAADPSVSDDEREHLERALRVLRDPQATATLASALLEGTIARVEDASPLLVAGGPVAARALIEARKGHAATLETRARFVSALRAIGPGTTPAIIDALEPLVNLVTRNDEAFAEDLLRSMPESMPEAAGDVTVKLARLDKPSVGALAVAVTANAWGRRAVPLLLGVLDSPVDVMRIAALESLKRIAPLEDPALERLARMLQGQVPAGDELKAAAARAFAAAAPFCHARAVAFLQSRLQPPQGLLGSVRQAFGKGESADVVLALCRALIALDSVGARPVLERYAASHAELRGEIEKLLPRAHA
jgi:serine/threonine protein kinase